MFPQEKVSALEELYIIAYSSVGIEIVTVCLFYSTTRKDKFLQFVSSSVQLIIGNENLDLCLSLYPYLPMNCQETLFPLGFALSLCYTENH